LYKPHPTDPGCPLFCLVSALTTHTPPAAEHACGIDLLLDGKKTRVVGPKGLLLPVLLQDPVLVIVCRGAEDVISVVEHLLCERGLVGSYAGPGTRNTKRSQMSKRKKKTRERKTYGTSMKPNALRQSGWMAVAPGATLLDASPTALCLVSVCIL